MAIISQHERTVLAATGPLIAVFFLLFPIFDGAADFLYRRSAERRIALVQNDLLAELGRLLTQAKEIAQSESVKRAGADKDPVNLLSLLNDERNARDIGFLIAIDGKGSVRARTHAIAKRGDRIFEATSWGQAASRGNDVLSFGKEYTLPLVMLAAHSEKDGDQIAETIVAGHSFDDVYADMFARRHLDGAGHAVFYSSEDGVTGSSFSDPPLKRLVSAYFNTGSDWIQKDRSGEETKLGGKYYLVYNIPLAGTVEHPGGLFIFFENPHAARSLILALFMLAIYCAVVYFIARTSGERAFLGEHKVIIIAAALAILFFAFFTNQIILDRKALPIKEIPYLIYNSTLRLRPDYGIFDAGTDQHVAIQVETGGEAINAVSAVVRYDPGMVQVRDIITVNSFCGQDFFIEKDIDNEKGEVRIACGLPTPGFAEKIGTVAELLLAPLQQGRFSLSFDPESQVLANDGLGTDVLRLAANGNYWAVEHEQAADALPRVSAFSRSHPSSETAYNNRDVDFSWIRRGNYEFTYLFDQSSTSIPKGENVIREQGMRFKAERDGIYYFHIATRRGLVTGPASHYKVIIDTMNPPPPVIRASASVIKPGEVVRFDFMDGDQTEARQVFYLKIDNGLFFPVGPQVFVPFIEAGIHTITVRYFDKAGNYADSKFDIRVEGESLFRKVINIDFRSVFR